jgi:hypothetical protein
LHLASRARAAQGCSFAIVAVQALGVVNYELEHDR